MRRIVREVVRALAGAAALTLSIAVVAPAQQAQADPAMLTEVQTAGVMRLKEIIEVLNTGDYAKTRAYFEVNSVDVRTDVPGVKPGSWNETTFAQTLDRYRASRGYDLVRVTIVPSRADIAVVGIVRNRTTWDEEYLAVRVEPQAPHRITWFPAIGGQDLATLALKPAASVAVTEQERLQEIGSYLKRMADADLFSGAIVIARDGKPVLAQAYGYADREKKIPNTVETPFLMASMTKPFTGLAIGQLVEQGKLSYDDPLAKFLPDFPDPESAKKIQIKHLLSHTSGLAREGSSIGSSSMGDPTTIRAWIDRLERKPLEFEPGTKHSYSNMGFLLLGRVIEIASGQDYYDYMQKNVFARAGTTTAGFPLLHKNSVPVAPMAHPYDLAWDPDSGVSVQSQLGRIGRRGSSAGGSIASALDILELSNAMRAGRIVKPETFRLHSSPKPELTATIYGYGIIAGPYLGRPFVGHNGRSFGQCTEFGVLTDTPYTVIVLSNLTMTTCRQVTQRILRVLRPSL